MKKLACSRLKTQTFETYRKTAFLVYASVFLYFVLMFHCQYDSVVNSVIDGGNRGILNCE